MAILNEKPAVVEKTQYIRATFISKTKEAGFDFQMVN
jgi:hypothetical protein